jgi:hypothetical protein
MEADIKDDSATVQGKGMTATVDGRGDFKHVQALLRYDGVTYHAVITKGHKGVTVKILTHTDNVDELVLEHHFEREEVPA